jgi:hypothetical protein
MKRAVNIGPYNADSGFYEQQQQLKSLLENVSLVYGTYGSLVSTS